MLKDFIEVFNYYVVERIYIYAVLASSNPLQYRDESKLNRTYKTLSNTAIKGK
jgi:hypothetical protein